MRTGADISAHWVSSVVGGHLGDTWRIGADRRTSGGDFFHFFTLGSLKVKGLNLLLLKVLEKISIRAAMVAI